MSLISTTHFKKIFSAEEISYVKSIFDQKTKESLENEDVSQQLIYQPINNEIPEFMCNKIQKCLSIKLDIDRSQVLKLFRPFTIHNDVGEQGKTQRVIMIPIGTNIKHKIGIYLLNQYSHHSLCIGPGYFTNYKKITQKNRKKYIQNLSDQSICVKLSALPHLSKIDCRYLSVNREINYKVGDLISFDARLLHTSLSFRDGKSKSLLTIFSKC